MKDKRSIVRNRNTFIAFSFFHEANFRNNKNILWDYQDNRIGKILPQTFNSKNLYKVNHL